MLFSDEGSPFIILLAIDPHVITKAIELNIHQAFRDTSIGGMAYLRNIVHLPFYLQNAGLRKVNVAQQLAAAGNSFFFKICKQGNYLVLIFSWIFFTNPA